MENITLGAYSDIPVYAQKWRYLANRTGSVIAKILENSQNIPSDGKGLVDWLGGSSYDLLVAMIPTVSKRIPEYAFNGYASQQAWENDEYDEEVDPSPTIPEIEEAFKVAIRVNRFDMAKVLTNLVDPKQLKEAITQRLTSAISRPSLNSQPVTGESESTNSGMTPPMSMPSEVSLLDDWRRSPGDSFPDAIGS